MRGVVRDDEERVLAALQDGLAIAPRPYAELAMPNGAAIVTWGLKR